MTPTSIKITNTQKIMLRRLGGSKWIRQQIEEAHESKFSARMVGESVDPMGKTQPSR
ncbi:MAG: hypothetical protein KGL39_23740 [Patescibacteria group bacterium]|nr:hypothetical protein [Patescibacteria group bacterium]